jgi:energy-coupling factor transport system ATP-binding protein
MGPIVEIRNLTYAYRRQRQRPALRGIDLTIDRGAFIAIAGRTGSGKSTLCYCLNALIPHSFGGHFEGEVHICGINTRAVSVPALARKVGFVLQNAESQLVGLSVEEDVAFGLENIALPREEVSRRVAAALHRVRLADRAHQSPWSLSGGQKQRLAIAAAIALEAELLVLDNPTAELDPVGKLEVMGTIAELNAEQGITVVMVNQELEEVVPYATRLILMDAGRIVSSGSLAEVVNESASVEQAGVKLPEVAEIARQLKSHGAWAGPLPLTVNDAASALLSHARSSAPGSSSRSKLSTSGEALIEVQNASFSYGAGSPVLRNVDLTIRRGEFVTLMGPNGTGKTTLAKHFNGLLKPTSGRVLVRDLDTRRARVAELAQTVGYVFQNPDHQLFARTLHDELAFGPSNLKWPPIRIEEAVEGALKHLGAYGRGAEDPFFMGLAERKLVTIASVLTMEPELLVLDEPATGADHESALRIMNYLARLHRNGLTIVIVTHDVSLAANFAERIVVLQSGSIVLDGSPLDVFQRTSELESCLVVPPQGAQLAQRFRPPLDACRVSEVVEQLVRQ